VPGGSFKPPAAEPCAAWSSRGAAGTAAVSGPTTRATRRSSSGSTSRRRSSTAGSKSGRVRCSMQAFGRRRRRRSPREFRRRRPTRMGSPTSPSTPTTRPRSRPSSPGRSPTGPTSASGCGAFLALLACLRTAPRARSPMQFSKWHGLGNDYLLVERAELAWALTPERVQRICDYHFGVGSDGIVEVTSANGDRAEVVIWNPDGSTAELSGNGTRIAARWLARRSGAGEVRIAVGPREVVATMGDGRQVEMDVGEVEVGEEEEIDVSGEKVRFVPVSVGNPHAVIRREPAREELLRVGARGGTR